MTRHRKSIGRKRTRSLVGFAAKDLCETIPKSLSPSEGLLMLLEQCFQYALSVVQKECIEREDFDIDSFKKAGATCWKKIKLDVEENKLCQLAVSEQMLTNKSFLGGALMKNEKVRMEAESKEWTEKLTACRSDLTKEVGSKPGSINVSRWKERDPLYDYSDIFPYTSSTHEKLQKQVDTLPTCETLIKRSLVQVKIHNENRQNRCEEYFMYKVAQTPRTLMKKIASANKH